MKTDVKQVVHYVSVMDRAGQETFIMNMYKNINREQLQFNFLCSLNKVGSYDEEIHELGGKLHYLNNNDTNSYSRYFREVYLLKKFFREHSDYDVFHIHTYHAFSAFLSALGAKLGGVKKVIVHSHNSKAQREKLHKIFRPILKLLNIERLACSREAAEWMYGDKLSNVELINNGIDVKQYCFTEVVRSTIRQELSISEDTLVLAHVGRFNYQKNHEYLIKIYSEVKKRNDNTLLLLIGEGELMSEIKQLAKKYQVDNNVLFLGNRSNIYELLQGIDVFVMPSLFEGLPVSLVEAQAAGLPCVISNTISPDVNISQAIEFIGLEDSVEIWAEKILQLKHSNDRRLEINDTVKETYDACSVAKKLSEIYLSK